MALSPRFKIFNQNGEYIASCKYLEDAALLAGNYPNGAKVKEGHTRTIWHEGHEEIPASASADKAADIMRGRVEYFR